MKPFDYYSKNDFAYPNKEDYRYYNVYKEDKCLRLKSTTIDDVYEIPEVSELIYRNIFPKNDFKNAVIDHCKKNGIFVVSYYDDTAYLKHKSDYNACELRLCLEFKRDALEDLGITDNPKADLLFDKAWEKGHSSGFREVYDHLNDLVELIV
jgi:hypothetical protein